VDRLKAKQEFLAYFEANYPPACILSVPMWHAEKIWRAAERALERRSLSQEAVRDERLEKTRYELARGLLQRFGKIGQMETAVKIVDFVLDKEGKWKD
jgi:hypothetical protein